MQEGGCMDAEDVEQALKVIVMVVGMIEYFKSNF